MEKMELKYLCGYLPHSLELLFDEKIYLMVPYDTIINISISSVCGVKVKPILLHLSALTEPEYQSVFDDLSEQEIDDIFDRLLCAEKSLIQYDTVCDTLSFRSVSLLFKNHFDVYGLIPAGLALDKRNFKI